MSFSVPARLRKSLSIWVARNTAGPKDTRVQWQHRRRKAGEPHLKAYGGSKGEGGPTLSPCTFPDHSCRGVTSSFVLFSWKLSLQEAVWVCTWIPVPSCMHPGKGRVTNPSTTRSVDNRWGGVTRERPRLHRQSHREEGEAWWLNVVPEGPWEYPCGRRCGRMTCGRSSEQGVVSEGAEKGLSEPLRRVVRTARSHLGPSWGWCFSAGPIGWRERPISACQELLLSLPISVSENLPSLPWKSSSLDGGCWWGRGHSTRTEGTGLQASGLVLIWALPWFAPWAHSMWVRRLPTPYLKSSRNSKYK